MAQPARRIPFLPQAEDASEEELDAVLEKLPSVEPKPPLPFPPADAAQAPRPSSAELELFLDSLQAETQVFVATQFARLQAELGGLVSPAELDEARAVIAELREQNARLLRQLDLYERAFRSLKDLADDVEEASR